MNHQENNLAPQGQGWQATLNLGFAANADNKTLLVNRQHKGPLTVQRPFYPEGDVCHLYILHPPGGIVGGDGLTINVNAAENSHALITTPAAGKFYRSSGAQASQLVEINLADNAIVEWLPQETIIYEGARLKSTVKLNCTATSRFIGWEILSLGRPASSEGFDYGEADLNWQIYLENQPLLLERLILDNKAFAARWGLQNYSACGTLFATPVSNETLTAIQELIGDSAGRAVTKMDNLLVCRALDSRSDKLRGFFEQVWAIIRPNTAQREVCAPRIWAT